MHNWRKYRIRFYGRNGSERRVAGRIGYFLRMMVRKARDTYQLLLHADTRGGHLWPRWTLPPVSSTCKVEARRVKPHHFVWEWLGLFAFREVLTGLDP